MTQTTRQSTELVILRFIKEGMRQVYDSIDHVLIGLGVISINLAISFYIRQARIDYIENFRPIGAYFGSFASTLILIFLYFLSIFGGFLKAAPIGSILVLGGVTSNYLEKFAFGSVADYMQLMGATINLADVVIVMGSLLVLDVFWQGKGKKQPN